jgi:fatty-acyl-CoA synthase
VSGVAVYGVADPVTGDQVMCAIEGDFDPVAWTTFLEHQPDLGTKWAPRFVRVVGTVPVTGTGKIDKQSLRADGWECGDAVWVRDGDRYRLLTDADRAELRQLHASHRKR